MSAPARTPAAPSTLERPGVVHDEGGLCLLDLRELPWEPHMGIPGGFQKTLARHPDGWSEVQVTWLPPNLDEGPKPERHYHRTVLERGLVLAGELPMREYASQADDLGVRVRFHQDLFMDRAPGSVHGPDPSRAAATGFEFLEWRTGPLTYLGEPGMEAETVVLPAARLP